MKFLTLVVLSLLVIGVSAFEAAACINVAGRESVGKRLKVEGLSAAEFMKAFTTHDDRAYWQKAREDLEEEAGRRAQLDFARNNLAVALLHLGEVKQAIAILEELERKDPGRYIVAANLGTAYELNGEDEKALEWIKKGVERNAESHFGTEWLHVKILETKIALAKDPQWLRTHTVLGADFGTNMPRPASEIFATDFQGKRKSLNEIEDALVYQLHERLEFIKPPEPVVADLLNDLSRAFSLLRTPEHARAVGELAIGYGAPPKEAPKKEASFDIAASNPSRGYLFYGAFAAAAALVAGALYLFVRRRQ